MASDITDRKRLEESLRLADRRKDEFLATLAHELRNPLAPIRNAIHLLTAARCRRRQSAGSAGYHRSPSATHGAPRGRSPRSFAHHARAGHAAARDRRSPQRPRRRVGGGGPCDRGSDSRAVCPELPADVLQVDGDPTRLSQLFQNILHNAAKYTPPGGPDYGAIGASRRRGAQYRYRDTGHWHPEQPVTRVRLVRASAP